MSNESEKILNGGEFIPDFPDNISFAEFLYEKIQTAKADRAALIDSVTNETITFGDVLKRTIRVANNLKNHYALKKGDVVGVCSENTPHFPVVVLAALFSHCTITTFNNTYTPDELIHCVEISKPKAIFCSSQTIGKLSKLLDKCPYIKHLILIDRPMKSSCVRITKVASYHDLVDGYERQNVRDYRFERGNPYDDVTAILYSSGTTGFPKGVMLTDRNLLVTFQNSSDPTFSLFGYDTVIVFLPMFHAYGFLVTFFGFAIHACAVIMPKFEIVEFLRLIETYRIECVMVVPPIVVQLLKTLDKHRFDLSSLNKCFTGAAPLGRDLTEQITKRLNLNGVQQGYGLTETTLGITLQPSDVNKYGTVGKLVRGALGKVVDIDTGMTLGPYREGELWFKSEQIMKGYKGNERATRETIDADGWLHTGDIGYYDNDEYFYIVDRLKELIKYNGFQVPPAELEALILKHPKVQDVGVVGMPDDETGEKPVAFVVVQAGANVTEEEIVQFVRERISPQKRLHGVRFVDEIPKNPSGKILRRELRKLLAEMHKVKSKL